MVTTCEVKTIFIQKYIDTLSSIPLFNEFSKEELLSQFHSDHYRIITYDKGQIIHLQNEICLTMDIILEGRADVQKMDIEGNILNLNAFYGGSILGANLLFASRNFYPMTVMAESKTVILHISQELIENLSKTNSGFTSALMREISDKTLLLTDRIDAISLKTIREKIFDYLRYEYSIQKTNKINLRMTKRELAERFGIQRTSLSRELQKMKKEGLIDYDAKTITLFDKI